MKKRISICGLLCMLLPGCADNRIDTYKDRTPKINMQHFFKGTVTGWGAIFDFTGKQSRSFTITMIGNWGETNSGTLEEHFVFDNGTKLDRSWNITFNADGSYVGTAVDIVGQAIGVEKGCASFADYKIRIPYKGWNVVVHMDDWTFQVDQNTVLNKAVMKKFGIKVGEMIIVLQKK